MKNPRKVSFEDLRDLGHSVFAIRNAVTEIAGGYSTLSKREARCLAEWAQYQKQELEKTDQELREEDPEYEMPGYDVAELKFLDSFIGLMKAWEEEETSPSGE